MTATAPHRPHSASAPAARRLRALAMALLPIAAAVLTHCGPRDIVMDGPALDPGKTIATPYPSESTSPTASPSASESASPTASVPVRTSSLPTVPLTTAYTLWTPEQVIREVVSRQNAKDPSWIGEFWDSASVLDALLHYDVELDTIKSLPDGALDDLYLDTGKSYRFFLGMTPLDMWMAIERTDAAKMPPYAAPDAIQLTRDNGITAVLAYTSTGDAAGEWAVRLQREPSGWKWPSSQPRPSSLAELRADTGRRMTMLVAQLNAAMDAGTWQPDYGLEGAVGASIALLTHFLYVPDPASNDPHAISAFQFHPDPAAVAPDDGKTPWIFEREGIDPGFRTIAYRNGKTDRLSDADFVARCASVNLDLGAVAAHHTPIGDRVRPGWGDEAMPLGLERGANEGIYVWTADGSKMRRIVSGGVHVYVDLQAVTAGDYTLFVRDLLPELQLPPDLPAAFSFIPADPDWNAKERLALPVDGVSWFGAATYARAVGKSLATAAVARDAESEMLFTPDNWIGAWGRAFTGERPEKPYDAEAGRQVRCVIVGPAVR